MNTMVLPVANVDSAQSANTQTMLEELLERLSNDTFETLETWHAAKAYLDEIFRPSALHTNINLDDLLQSAKNGLEAETILKDSSEQEQLSLEIQVKKGEDARLQLIRSYQPLVVSVAKRYIGRGPRFMELIHYGTQGLHHYIDRWEREKAIGNPLLVNWYIRNAINGAIATRPATLNHLITVQKHLKVELDYDPTDEEIALEMGMLEMADAVKIHMARHGDSELEPTIEEKLQEALNEVKRLKQLIWPSITNPATRAHGNTPTDLPLNVN